MELAIPGIALSLLWIAKKAQNVETFTDQDGLTNTNIPDRNYNEDGEDVASNEVDDTAELTVNNRYENSSGAYTDKYFNQSQQQNNPAMEDPSFMSLTGEKVGGSYFEHNNMVPFFGSNLRTQIQSANTTEGIVDSYTGSGSQHINKKEQSPMFSPDENEAWAHGAPNRSDFFQSRVNSSMKMANVKPFQEEQVAPGLGLGYTTEGGNGFNSGMMQRDSWMPKTADELRVETNPKANGISLYGHEGPAASRVKNIGTTEQMGAFEKNRPDQSFALDQRSMDKPNERDIGRLFTTGGAEKGATLHSIPVDRYVSRPETTASYGGVANSQNPSTYVPGEYMDSHNQQLGAVPIAVANAHGRNGATDADYGIKSKKAYPNNRSSNKQDGYFGMVRSSIGAAVAPLLDVLRPSRKENAIGTLRPYQNPGTTVPQSYIFNPADRPSATIREMTEDSKNHLNVNANQNGGAYQVADQQVANTNRNDTGDFYYAGVAGAGAGTKQMKSYESGYNQRNNDIKSSTIKGHMVSGNMNLMNGDINMRQKSRDNDLKNSRPITGTMPHQSPDVSNMGRLAGTDNSLYANIQMDRNSPDITNMLKSNPYVVDYTKAL